jgi:diguanylate cyclase
MKTDAARPDSAELPNRQNDTVDTLATATVMMIDDDVFTLEVIKEFLGEAGYSNIIALSQPAEAIKEMRRTQPDVVLLDLLMPGISGFDILREMRADDELRFMPVIMLTAASDAETKLEALELGAADFLAKPVDPSELTLRLRNTLAFKAYHDRLAHFDNLTDLPNRRSFIGSLSQVLRQPAATSGKVAVLHVDLDRFKQINETLGYDIGDTLLGAVAHRFRNAMSECQRTQGYDLRDSFVLSRFGGDEFAVLIPDLPEVAMADHAARRMLASLAEPFRIGKHELFVTASIGIAVSPQDGTDVVTLLKHAEVAMHAAKQHGRDTCKYYSPELNALAMERLTLETGLRRAIDRSELVLHYQPQVEVATGRIIGVEALMRWQHPELGLIMPVRFISLAEEAGLIDELGNWALFEACRQVKAWEQAGFGGLTMSVNVATPQFRRAGFADTVRKALASAGIAPGQLILEMTESMLMTQAEQAIAQLHEIKSIGVGLSLDDFGTGYSSFSYLKNLPLDEIKVDRSFVADMETNPQSAAIVAAILALAEGLGLKVIVEGVETEAQLARLAARDCRYYQGFLYSRPEPAEQVLERLARASQ